MSTKTWCTEQLIDRPVQILHMIDQTMSFSNGWGRGYRVRVPSEGTGGVNFDLSGGYGKEGGEGRNGGGVENKFRKWLLSV